MQKKDNSFFKYVLFASIITILSAFYPVYKYATLIQIYSIITGFIVSLTNVIAGYLLIEIGLNKTFKTFMIVIFGGMIVRMMIIFSLMILFLYAFNLDSTALISSLLFYYFLFSSIEIFFVNKNKQLKQKE